jgi:hypothetical protein
VSTGLASCACSQSRRGLHPHLIWLPCEPSTGGLAVAATSSCVIVDAHAPRKRIACACLTYTTIGGFCATVRGLGPRKRARNQAGGLCRTPSMSVTTTLPAASNLKQRT